MNLLCFLLSFSLLFFRQPLHFIKFVHFWLSVLYKQLVCCHIFFFFSFPQSRSLLLIVLLALSRRVSERGISFESIQSAATPFRFHLFRGSFFPWTFQRTAAATSAILFRLLLSYVLLCCCRISIVAVAYFI